MRLLVIHNTYRESGGEDIVVDQELDLLRRRGHDVLPVIFNNSAIRSALDRAAVTLRVGMNSASAERLPPWFPRSDLTLRMCTTSSRSYRLAHWRSSSGAAFQSSKRFIISASSARARSCCEREDLARTAWARVDGRQFARSAIEGRPSARPPSPIWGARSALW